MKNNNEDFVNALLGAALLSAAAEKKSDTDTATAVTPNTERTAARMARKLFDAFMYEGFTSEQATAFVAAIMS